MRYHFIGIGGIGMSSLAKILLQNKTLVKGSDLSSGELVLELKKMGAEIFEEHKKENLSEDDIIVYSSAIKENNPELSEARKKKMQIIHRSELLKKLMAGHLPLLVAGTHGKTTSTSLLSQVLIDAGFDPTYSIGGILNSSKTNANLGKGKYFVAEADESDGSFLNYSGYGGIILNIEKEHFSYWNNLNNLKKGFSKFISNIERKDLIIWCNEDPILREMNPPGESYGFSSEADIFAENIRAEGFQMVFDISYKKLKYKDVRLNLTGNHNVLNAMAVFLLAKKIGIEEKQIFKTFASFSGVKRRMDKIGEINKSIFFDDYGHHPSEIKATLAGLRKVMKERKIICVFQPHRFSRTKELFEEFEKCFADADELFITDIYSAGEENKENVDVHSLVEKVKQSHKRCSYINKKSAAKDLASIIRPHDVILFSGAGDITKIGKEVFNEYRNNPSKLKVSLVFGGKSPEPDISKMSAASIYKNLDLSIYDVNLFYVGPDGKWKEADSNLIPISSPKENLPSTNSSEETVSSDIMKKIVMSDICFPVFHGLDGKDGMIQGFFETLNIAYVGSSYAACSLSMNNAWVKYIAKESNLPILEFIEIKKNMWEENKKEFVKAVLKKFSLPVFIKPCHPGSGLGVKKLESFDNLEADLDEIFTLADSLLIEEGITVKEIEVAVLGNTFIEASVPGEVLTGGAFYASEKKYEKNDCQTIVPANISSENIAKVKKNAVNLYKLIGCEGMAKVGFFVKENEIYVNTLSPMPCLIENSLYSKMWDKNGIGYKDLLDRLIVLGLNKKLIKI